MVEMNSIFEYLKESSVVVPLVSLLNSTIWLLQKLDGCWRMIVFSARLNQALSPATAVALNVLLLLQQINKVSGTWDAATGLANRLFSIQIRKQD